MRLARIVFSVMMFCSTSAAAADGAYMALKGGITSPIDLEYTRPFTGNSVSSEYENGYGASFAVGTKKSHVRLEFEGSYQQADIDKHDVSTFGSAGSVGETSVIAVMGNAYYDFDMSSMPLKPYLGAGIGGAYVNYDGHRTTTVGLIDDTQAAFAYQGMAGMSYELDGSWDMTVEYRYFSTSGIELSANNQDVDYQSHSIMAGLTRRF